MKTIESEVQDLRPGLVIADNGFEIESVQVAVNGTVIVSHSGGYDDYYTTGQRISIKEIV